MKIIEKLKEHLSEQDVEDILKEYNEQVNATAEAKIAAYDDKTVKDINDLISEMDNYYTVQTRKAFEARSQKEKERLNKLTTQYNKKMAQDAKEFKDKLASSIQSYVDNKIENIVSYSQIQEAARNNVSHAMLCSLRKQLSIDSALMQESISEPILDARKKLSKYTDMIKQLRKQNTLLTESLQNSERNLLLEQKVENLPTDTAKHIRHIMGDKDIKFINENFDYIVKLYNTERSNARNTLTEQTINSTRRKNSAITEPKRRTDLIEESFDNSDNEDELLNDILSTMRNKR